MNITAHIPRVLLHVLDESLRPPSRSVRNANLPPASLIIPTRDNAAVLKPCVKSLLANTDYPDFELIIVDNGSVEPEALDYLADLERRHEAVVVRADIPFNYSKLNNLGTACARGEVLAFLNNDIEALHPDWLAILTEWAVREDIGCAGARLLYPNRRIQHAGIILGINGCAGHAWKGSAPESSTVDFRLRYPRTVSANTGACLVVARDRLNRLGGFDETLAVAFNDVDFCLRLQQAGLRNVWTPEATLIHHESASGRRNDTPRKKASLAREKGILRQRWGNTLDTDPYYSPNLTLACEDGGLAVPPRLPNGTDAF